MAVKPGGGFAKIARDAGAQNAPGSRRYGIVKSIGDGTVDVMPDDKSGLKRKLPLRGGLPLVGDRIEIQSFDGVEVAQADVTQASAARSAGLIVLDGASFSSGGAAYPLPHASTHFAGGSDPIAPANIGAAVMADITGAMNTHLAAGDPHPTYLLASGARNVGGMLNSQSIIPLLSNTYDLGSAALPWRRIYASEFDTSTLVAGAVQSIGGKIIVAKDTGVLPGQIVAADATINFGKAMTPNDFLLFQGLGQLEYMQVGTLVSGTTYNVTRNLDGSGANSWPAGAVWVDLGYSGNGYIILDANAGSPTITLQLAGTTYNGYTTPVQIDTNGVAILTKSVEYPAGKIKFATAAGVSVLDISTKEVSAYEEDVYITSGSNFTGTDKSGVIFLTAKGKDTSANDTSASIEIAGGTNPSAWPTVNLTVWDVTSGRAGISSLKLYGNGMILDVPMTVKGLTYPSVDGTANQYLKTNGAGVLSWANTIGCRLIRGTAQTIANATWTAIQFDAEYFDTDTMHDNVTNNTRITIRTAGYYMIGGCVEWVSNTTGMRLMQIWKNNAVVLTSAVHNSDQYGAAPGTLSTVHYLAVNDYIELLVYQASGGNLNTATMYDYSPVFWAMRIG